jgi:hypothetical protein
MDDNLRWFQDANREKVFRTEVMHKFVTGAFYAKVTFFPHDDPSFSAS